MLYDACVSNAACGGVSFDVRSVCVGVSLCLVFVVSFSWSVVSLGTLRDDGSCGWFYMAMGEGRRFDVIANVV